MSKKLLIIAVRGNQKTWGFNFYGDPKYIQEWRDDGLEIGEVQNVIPVWIVNIGLTRMWCFFQDVFNFKNPWA